MKATVASLASVFGSTNGDKCENAASRGDRNREMLHSNAHGKQDQSVKNTSCLQTHR